MKLRSLKCSPIFYVICVLLALQTTPAIASGVFSQLIFTFDQEKIFAYRYDKGDHALVLEFKDTIPSELAALDHYDERLIKRVLIKDMSPHGTEVKLILRDHSVRAHVDSYKEPYRIAVDLFDQDYAQTHDPQTGLPLVGTQQGTNSKYQFVDGSGTGTVVQNPVSPGQKSPSKHSLLQPMPKVFVSPGELNDKLAATPGGVGRQWRDFPPYIYRIQTAQYEAGGRSRSAPAKSVDSAEAMATYAGELFNLGHENKALVAYQQVLHKDASIFDSDALHLWKFAETHLGQGNNALARGYYQALLDKHPASPLAQFAKLRLMDIAAVRAIQKGKEDEIAGLYPSLNKIKTANNGELAALVAIRKAHWSPANKSKADPRALPPISQDTYNELAAAYPTVQSGKTKYHTASLVLQKMLDKDTPWTPASGRFASEYFRTFANKKSAIYNPDLKKRLYTKINGNLQKKSEKGQLASAIQDYESLPSNLRSVENNPKTAWSLAESYRNMSQWSEAVQHYEVAAQSSDTMEKFKANFWLAVTAGLEANRLNVANKSPATAKKMANLSRDADNAISVAWQALTPADQQTVATAYKNELEEHAIGVTRLRSVPKIVLSQWTTTLSTNASTENSTQDINWQSNFSPSGSSVIYLSELAKRFAKLGMTNERRTTLGLLKTLKPAQLGDDKAAKALWANELVTLAEDYRKNSQYLDAGRTYSLVGANAENWEGRAEALYKGGLLLYRAGRREEALAAFKSASEDGNNLHYANLAKERLSQID